MNKFIFEDYYFDNQTATAHFEYSFENGVQFKESVTYEQVGEYDKGLLDRALFLGFLLVGTSYYKCFPSSEIILKTGGLNKGQAEFFNKVYQEGMGQFAFENNLKRGDLAHFQPSTSARELNALPYAGQGIMALQSGGKDSLLLASELEKRGIAYTPCYMRYHSDAYPLLLDKLAGKPRLMTRHLDVANLKKATAQGGRNGHVPVTYIVMSFALIDAILHGNNTILLAIGAEGEEPASYIDDLPVNHQWAKTWQAEQLFSRYVTNYISPDIKIGSPLRGLSELKIAEMFAQDAWAKYGHDFSSCNLANYKQGHGNQQLKWDGTCPKCANSFLLFAPFIEPTELKSIFDGQDLFANPNLTQTFKGLFGLEDIAKPFECVSDIAELRRAYHMAQEKWGSGYTELPFSVPHSDFDYQKQYPVQEWTKSFIGPIA